MIGMVLVTHGLLATEFKAALEHVVGPQDQIETITIGPEDDMELRRGEIMSAVCRVNTGEGVVVLTDMFGGTPSNLALSCMNGGSVEVVAGDQPADADQARERPRRGIARARPCSTLRKPGRKYINVASRVLAGK